MGPDPNHKDPLSAPPVIHLEGFPEPLHTAAGRPVGSNMIRKVPLFQGAKQVGVLTHWINEAAKHRNGGDFKKAKPAEVVVVPLLRGTPASIATRIRGIGRKRQRQSLLERMKIMAGVKSAGASV